MEIKLVHAHFLITTGDYCNERIGFTVELHDETVEEAVTQLRHEAIKIVGRKAQELYDYKWNMERACEQLEKKLQKLREEWNATSEFLRTQGIKPDSPSMPQFNQLLAAAKIEEESVSAEFEDPDF